MATVTKSSIVVDTPIAVSWSGGSSSYSLTIPAGYYAEYYYIALTGTNPIVFQVDGNTIFSATAGNTKTATIWPGTTDQFGTAGTPVLITLSAPFRFGAGQVVSISQGSPIVSDTVVIRGLLFKNS